MTQPHESSLTAADGTILFVADWPVVAPAATGEGIVLLHGLGEHCGRYAHMARFFNECGLAVRAYDHRGHGRSGGARGDVPDSGAITRDAKIVIEDFARTLSSPPLLLGHSMGGLFAADYALRSLSPLSGLILSSPALRIRLSAGQRLLLRFLRATAPGLGVPNGLRSRYLSHRRDVVEAYDSDPLVHRKISARLIGALQDAIDRAQAHAAALGIKTLLVVAGEDRLVDTSGSEAFFGKLAPGVGTRCSYPGFYHEVFNETEAHRAFEDVRAWLAQLRAAQSRTKNP